MEHRRVVGWNSDKDLSNRTLVRLVAGATLFGFVSAAILRLSYRGRGHGNGTGGLVLTASMLLSYVLFGLVVSAVLPGWMYDIHLRFVERCLWRATRRIAEAKEDKLREEELAAYYKRRWEATMELEEKASKGWCPEGWLEVPKGSGRYHFRPLHPVRGWTCCGARDRHAAGCKDIHGNRPEQLVALEKARVLMMRQNKRVGAPPKPEDKGPGPWAP